MTSHSFGTLFRLTTWGESHGKAVGVVVDGCPAGLRFSEEDVEKELVLRAPGQRPYTSIRQEPDRVEILSGVFQQVTTGAPISMLIHNKDADPSKYTAIKDLLRPGHANYPYLEKFGVFDYRGGGRSSARETAGRVAAGALAKKLLRRFGIEVLACLCQVGNERAEIDLSDDKIVSKTRRSPLFCPDEEASMRMAAAIQKVQEANDSIGGAVLFFVRGIPAGLGDPIYGKLQARFACGMLSIPACKGFEIGSGFSSCFMRGSEHNDPFTFQDGKIGTKTNHAGGVLGGISTGMPIWGKVAFKPTSSIGLAQQTYDLEGRKRTLTIPAKSRHDPCVAVRAVSVVEAMSALVLADALLLYRVSKLDSESGTRHSKGHLQTEREVSSL